jgi:hypothetical protein
MSSGNYLRPMLEAGSARVFNCNDRARRLLSAGDDRPYFFETPVLHHIVLVKEAWLDQRPSETVLRPAIGTKVYLPYNHDDVYEGGRSIFMHEPRFLEVLNEMLGLNGAIHRDHALERDLKILHVLDQLPTLDGFLIRDALEIEGIAPNESYFEITGPERAAINEFLRRKFEPLVQAAFRGYVLLPNRVNDFVEKIWEAKDKEALAALIEALGFPPQDALTVFAAWKGINYYTFEYHRSERWRGEFSVWLRDKAIPRQARKETERAYFNVSRRSIANRVRRHWNAAASIIAEYDMRYRRLVTGGDVRGFLSFLQGAHELYWRMGNSLSKLNHAVFCWDKFSEGVMDRRLSIEKTSELFQVLQRVFAGEEDAREQRSRGDEIMFEPIGEFDVT